MNNSLENVWIVVFQEIAASFGLMGLRNLTYCLKVYSAITESANECVSLASDICKNYSMMNDTTSMRYRNMIDSSFEKMLKVKY